MNINFNEIDNAIANLNDAYEDDGYNLPFEIHTNGYYLVVLFAGEQIYNSIDNGSDVPITEKQLHERAKIFIDFLQMGYKNTIMCSDKQLEE